jgi:hypothetical protein
MYVAGWATPLNFTAEEETNPVPLMVSLCAAEPAWSEGGVNPLITGAIGVAQLVGAVAVALFEVAVPPPLR